MQVAVGNVLNKCTNLVDTDETKQAYARAMGYTTNEDYAQLKAEYEALKKRYEQILVAVEDSTEAVLRIAREGKMDL
jgi:predicted  nucleic acid-binding Zn-ribbon protein